MNLKKMKGYMPQCASIARDKDSTWQQLTDSAILGELSGSRDIRSCNYSFYG